MFNTAIKLFWFDLIWEPNSMPIIVSVNMTYLMGIYWGLKYMTKIIWQQFVMGKYLHWAPEQDMATEIVISMNYIRTIESIKTMSMES